MKRLLVLITILLLVMPAMAQDDMDPCVLDSPMDSTEVNFMGWAFPITEFFASELEKCNEVDNLTVNTQLLDSASSEEQANLALAGGGDSPWAILHTVPSRMVTLAGFDALLPLNDLVEAYREEYNLDDIPQPVWDAATIAAISTVCHLCQIPCISSIVPISLNSTGWMSLPLTMK